MNRKSKSLFTLTGVTLTGLATVAVLSFSQGALHDENAFCGNLESVVFDQNLPVSHPVNRCADHQSQGVSWSEWFTGRSSSYQFHFIDLLELLSRSGNSQAKNPTQTN
ncbi:MAG: hypothetical protein ACI9LX_000477 [Paraglaciecola sp.]|jgi:hypothetical protein